MKSLILMTVVGLVLTACGEASASDLTESGQKAAAKSEWQQALVRYDKTLAKDAGFTPAYAGRARARTETQDYEGAIADIGKAMELQPDLAADVAETRFLAYGGRATTSLDNSKFDEAIADFQTAQASFAARAEELNAGLARAHLGRGKRLVLQVNYSPASGNDPAGRMALIEETIAALETARGLDPALQSEVAEPLGTVLSKRGWSKYLAARTAGFTNGVPNDQAGHQDALRDYEAAIALKPTDGELYYERGSIHASLGDFAHYQSDRVRAIDLGQREARHYYGAGMAFWSTRYGDLQTAISYFTKAIEVDPRYAPAYEYRGRSYGLLNDCKAFLTDWNKAKSLTTEKRMLDYFKEYEDRNAYGCFR